MVRYPGQSKIRPKSITVVAWMLLHVILSLFHSLGETAAHCAIFAPLAYLLFRKSSSSFFQLL